MDYHFLLSVLSSVSFPATASHIHFTHSEIVDSRLLSILHRLGFAKPKTVCCSSTCGLVSFCQLRTYYLDRYTRDTPIRPCEAKRFLCQRDNYVQVSLLFEHPSTKPMYLTHAISDLFTVPPSSILRGVHL